MDFQEQTKLFEHKMITYLVEQTDSSLDRPEGWPDRYTHLAELVAEVLRTFSTSKVEFLDESVIFLKALIHKVVTCKEDF